MRIIASRSVLQFKDGSSIHSHMPVTIQNLSARTFDSFHYFQKKENHASVAVVLCLVHGRKSKI